MPSNIGNLLGSNSESDEASGSAGHDLSTSESDETGGSASHDLSTGESDETGGSAGHDLSTSESDETGGSGDVRAAILRLEKFKPLCYMQDQ